MKRHTSCALLAIGISSALSACTLGIPADGSRSTAETPSVSVSYIDGTRDIWSIGVGLRKGDEGLCLEDPAVGTAIQSADLPSSALGIDLIPGSEMSDAQRVAECLERAYDEATITVSAPGT